MTWYTTVEEAQIALETAAADVAADTGEDAVEAGWYDIVHATAAFCTPEVAANLVRRNL